MSEQILNTTLHTLDAIMASVSEEIYVFDSISMQLISSSASVQKNLGCSLEELQTLSYSEIFHEFSSAKLKSYISQIRESGQAVTCCTSQKRQDGSVYATTLKMQLANHDNNETLVVIGFTPAAQMDVSRLFSEPEVHSPTEAHSHTLGYKMPGLIYQLRRSNDKLSFHYLSAGCQDLLGLAPESLQRDAALFSELILPEDRTSFFLSMYNSAKTMKVWNWEGRIWIEDCQDVKWINFRSTPRKIANDVIQWEGIMTNITQSKNEKNEIERAHHLLAELTAHMAQINEQDRQRIAREIHDDLGGNLTAIKIGLAAITKRLSPNQTLLLAKTKQLEDIVDQTVEATHRISSDLRPDILNLGIVAAIEWLAKQFNKNMGIDCNFITDEEDIPVTSEQSIALFRICQESLSNIAKHANASLVTITLTTSELGIELQVTDDGIGISPADHHKTNAFGLRGMTERVSILNGNLSISPAATRGTRISAWLPLTENDSYAEVQYTYPSYA
jgi:two-component system sensor histidine kinase UhpB